MAAVAPPPNRRTSIASQEYLATMGRGRRKSMAPSKLGARGARGSEDMTGREGHLIKYENTYKMMPDEGTRFAASKVHLTVHKILETFLKDRPYQGDQIGFVTSQLADMIRREVRELQFRRYKLVVSVFLAQKTGESVQVSSQAVWDEKTDNFTSVTYNGSNYTAVAIVHGCYFE